MPVLRFLLRLSLGPPALLFFVFVIVIAGFVAHRRDIKTTDLAPQTIAWTMLAVALSAYEHWLSDESVPLPTALGNAFDLVGAGLNGLDP